MQPQGTKKIDFKGKELFIGLDVHKKSWSVTILAPSVLCLGVLFVQIECCQLSFI